MRDLVKEAKYLAREVTDRYERAMKSEEGLQAVARELGGLHISLGSCSFGRGKPVMEAIAEKIIGPNWEWTISETVDGSCCLVLLRCRTLDLTGDTGEASWEV